MFRSRRTSLASLAALVAALLPAVASPQVTRKMIVDTPSDGLAEVRRLGNITNLGAVLVDEGTNWRMLATIWETPREGAGLSGDWMIVQLDERRYPIHVVAPHWEAPNPNPLESYLVVDDKDYKGGIWSEGMKIGFDFVQHYTHWDLYLQNLSYVQAAGVDIMSWDWAILGMHLYRKDFFCMLGGCLGDGGQSMDHLGSVVAVADTLDNVLHVSGVVNGVAPSSVMSACVRAGAGGPVIADIGLQSLGDDGEGALTIHAQYLGIAHSDIPALLESAYLEIVTTQGVVVRGSLGLAPASNVAAVVPAPSTSRLVLEAPSPNPATRELRLHYDVPAALAGQRIELRVHDVLGRLVRSIDRGAAEAGDGAITVDLRADGGRLDAGLYFVTLRVGAQTATRRFLVTR